MRMTVIQTRHQRKRQDSCARCTEKQYRRARTGWLHGRIRQVQQPARPKAPLGAKSTCPAAGFVRPLRQAGRHLGNVSLQQRAPALPNHQISYLFAPPKPEDFVQLRSDCGWGEIGLDTAKRALERSVIDLTCFEGEHLIGMGRVVGDGVLYFYLQDIIVRPSHQNRSIGRQIVSKLLEEALARAATGATIGLMSAKGKETFYQHFGFQERPTDQLGAGMTQFVLTK